jgi:SAM-dependent methyltransferase
MFTIEDALRAVETPEIADLKTSAMTQSDVVNLILQRSEIIQDQPDFKKSIRRWMKGDDTALLSLIDTMGMDTLVRRAAGFIHLEYLQLRPMFAAKKPRAIADIGCGYALFDLFLARDFGCDLFLIDLESNDTRHFGFQPEGAAYSSLSVAKQFLVDNGISEPSIKTLNPEKDDVDALRDLDFAFSFLSCGYHYPWQTYAKLFQEGLGENGRIIIDVRARTLGKVLQEFSEIGYLRFLGKYANGSAGRVLIVKAVDG